MILWIRDRARLFPIAVVLATLTGCGTIQTRDATEQLLVSDAVDQSLDKLEFHPLSHEKVFLDTRYVRGVRGVGFVNADYIISALRERMAIHGCLLQENMEDADYVVELRIGALGTDGHEFNYGIPGSNSISTTTTLMGGPPVPQLPELSFARRDERRASVKVGVFAYHRQTREPVWQPGTVHGNSVAKATWVLGAGPFHDGKIYDGSKVGSEPLHVRALPRESSIVLRLLPWRKPTMDDALIEFQEPNVSLPSEGQVAAMPFLGDPENAASVLNASPTDDSRSSAGESAGGAIQQAAHFEPASTGN